MQYISAILLAPKCQIDSDATSFLLTILVNPIIPKLEKSMKQQNEMYLSNITGICENSVFNALSSFQFFRIKTFSISFVKPQLLGIQVLNDNEWIPSLTPLGCASV